MDGGTVVLGLLAFPCFAVAIVWLQDEHYAAAALCAIIWLLTWVVIVLQRIHELAWRAQFDRSDPHDSDQA